MVRLVTVPDEFFVGVQQLNHQEFYACHDTLEALWFEALEPEKSIYQGILQIAVGCYHLSNLNVRGATILVGEGLRRLRSTDTDVYGGYNLNDFIRQGELFLSSLQMLTPEAVEDFLAALSEGSGFPRLQVV